MTSHINCYYISIQIVKEKELQYTLKCYSEKGTRYQSILLAVEPIW